MPIRPNSNHQGFSLIELMISMGIAAVVLLAVVSANEFLLKSSHRSNMTSEQTRFRNLIQLSLLQKNQDCGDSPESSCCARNLRTAAGTEIQISGYTPGTISTPGTAIDHSTNLRLRLRNGPDNQFFISDGDEDRRARLRYEILLLGNFKQRIEIPANGLNIGRNTYSGFIEFTAHRQHLTGLKLDQFTTNIPLEFHLDDNGRLLSCHPRPEGRSIFEGRNSVNDCYVAGGVPVPTSEGLFCRFRSPHPPLNFTLPDCPEGWSGKVTTGCKLDSVSKDDSPKIETIPPCPKPSEQDEAKGKGNYYCLVKGAAPPVPPNESAECPEVPDIDPEDYEDDPPPPRWVYMDYDYPTKTLYCKWYKSECPEGWTETTDPADKVTPACEQNVSSCPDGMKQITPSPLTCALELPTPTSSGSASCGGNFSPWPSNSPESKSWNQDGKHILCF